MMRVFIWTWFRPWVYVHAKRKKREEPGSVNRECEFATSWYISVRARFPSNEPVETKVTSWKTRESIIGASQADYFSQQRLFIKIIKLFPSHGPFAAIVYLASALIYNVIKSTVDEISSEWIRGKDIARVNEINKKQMRKWDKGQKSAFHLCWLKREPSAIVGAIFCFLIAQRCPAMIRNWDATRR